MEGKRILVVDDEADLREAMCTGLSAAGMECLEAKDGEEGLKKAFDEKPDLILLDIMMPNIDGHEVLRRLRNDPWGQKVKVVLLTALDDVESIARSIENKSDDYIIKSTASLDEIVNKVKQQLVGYHEHE